MPARLPAATFGLDVERLRAGYYTDQYFNNIRHILGELQREGYHYDGDFPRADFPNPEDWLVGDAVVEMQFFTKREPYSIACGVDEALAMLSHCCGMQEADGYRNTCDQLEVAAIHDGDKLPPWQPAIRVRGRYRDFGFLETTMLGALSRGTKIATNVDACLEAAGGKTILYFPARFDTYLTQAADGYAYRTAVEAYNARHGAASPVRVSTDAQGAWWGGRGGGTIAHAYVLCFLADTAESVLHFARLMPPESPRIALVDTNNDCVTDSLRTARKLFDQFYRLYRQGKTDEAEHYRLRGVRPDTSERMRDWGIEPLGDPALDCGVTPRLVTAMRDALDAEGERIEVEDGDRDLAREWFRGVGVVVTGGFNPEKIAMFERIGAPVQTYGVGSALLKGPNNDFTADIVAVRHEGVWHELAKVGRGRVENPGLEAVELPLA